MPKHIEIDEADYERMREEIEQLRAWKREATQVLDNLDLQEIGSEIGLPLGSDISPQVLPFICKQKVALKVCLKFIDDYENDIEEPLGSVKVRKAIEECMK